jgi:hypothetical protein
VGPGSSSSSSSSSRHGRRYRDDFCREEHNSADCLSDGSSLIGQLCPGLRLCLAAEVATGLMCDRWGGGVEGSGGGGGGGWGGSWGGRRGEWPGVRMDAVPWLIIRSGQSCI